MPNKKIFCNVPWTNTHIYWDGSFGMCCSEKSKIYHNSQSAEFNLKNYTITDWYNSKPLQQARSDMMVDNKLLSCRGCYYEEYHGYESRRIKENFKSVIFTEQAFEKSYQQSHWKERFESTLADPPIDWHIDLGNECNLACKMCNPNASSLVADKYRRWGIDSEIRKNWVNDQESYDNLIKSIDSVAVRRIHFMGGEPMLSKRFRDIVNYLIEHNKHTNLSISFVTNGTIVDQEFIDKLKTFKSFDIEISLESIYKNNNYIRQGSEVTHLLNNIKSLMDQQTETFKVILRSVPQLLNVNNYDQYILWAWKNNVSIQGIPLIEPDYLKISVLPKELRLGLISRYQSVVRQIQEETMSSLTTVTTGRNTKHLDLQLIRECQSIIDFLKSDEPSNVIELRTQLRDWLIQWDSEFNLNAYDYYPEYAEFLKDIGYNV